MTELKDQEVKTLYVIIYTTATFAYTKGHNLRIKQS